MTQILPLLRREIRPIATRSWPEILRASDPLAAWKEDFEVWIANVKEFRTMETSFLQSPDNDEVRRVHRGWICFLISEGERRALELLNLECEEDERAKHLEFVDTFNRNLQSTLATWHSFEDEQGENPLKSFFA